MQINEMRDTTISASKFEIVESSETVNGFHTLAKVKGTFFVPNGKSRNNRFYSRELWEKALSRPEVVEKMKKRLMFGTIGHDLEIDDKALRDGLVSHIVTNAYIDDAGLGIGEAYVLDTPAGKALNAFLRAGCELYVSSRANGAFSGEKDGVPAVDEDAYDLVGWDFVMEAGFLQANPKLAESLNKLNLIKNNETILKNKENQFMTSPLNEELVKATLNENKDLKGEVKRLNEEVEQMKADADTIEKENKDLVSQSDELKPKLEKLAKYEEMGSPEEIKAEEEEAKKNEEELDKYKELGTPEEVKESMQLAEKTIARFTEKFGPEKILEQALSVATETGEEVQKLGGMDKIKEAVAIADKLMADKEADDKEKEISELATEMEMPKEEVAEMLKTSSKEQIKTLHAKMSESMKKSSFVPKQPVVISEAAVVETTLNESRFDRLNAAFT